MQHDASSSDGILIYGATGYIGGLTAQAVLDLGVRPLLGGRSAERLMPLAERLGVECRAAELSDDSALDRSLTGVRLVLNAAGPFASTAARLVDAAVRCGVHYLDLTGEVAVFEQVRARGADARRRGTMLLPGVGFDVVPSDCLATYVAARVPAARTLRIAVSGLELMSRGSARTLAEQVGRPPFVRRDGRLVPIPSGSLERTFDFGAGPSPSVAVSWGDLATAFVSTGIPNIETYFDATPMVRMTVAASRFLGPVMSIPPWRSALSMLASGLPGGPEPEERRVRAAVIVAEAENRSGRIARARLQTPEAYTLSARTAAAVARDVVAGHFEPGFQTPARLFGADYILRFEGVTRESLVA